MKKQNWLILLSSAIGYALPFILSQYLWWLVFLFPVPLLYVVAHDHISFREGYLWGIITFTLHLSGVLYAIITMAQGSYFLRLVPSLFIVLYAALYSGIWFWFTSKLSIWLGIKNKVYCAVILPGIPVKENKTMHIFVLWTVTLWFFILWIDWYCMWIFNRCEGSIFMHPLVPLAEYPQLLQLLPIIGKPILTLLLLAVPTCITTVFIKKNLSSLFALCISLLPWLASLCIVHNPPTLDWCSKITPLPVIFKQTKNLHRAAYALQHQFRTILKQRPHTELIVMPESSLYCNSLITKPELVKLWNKSNLGKPIHIILGTFRCNDTNRYNTLYWIYDGNIKVYFDKRHVMSLVEKIPAWFNFNFIRRAYFPTFSEISIGTQERPLLNIFENVPFVPYICSDFFCNEYPDDQYPNTTIIAICNDFWFDTSYYPSYMQRLMYLAACFKAIQWQRNIVYVSFSCSACFDIYGNAKAL